MTYILQLKKEESVFNGCGKDAYLWRDVNTLNQLPLIIWDFAEFLILYKQWTVYKNNTYNLIPVDISLKNFVLRFYLESYKNEVRSRSWRLFGHSVFLKKYC